MYGCVCVCVCVCEEHKVDFKDNRSVDPEKYTFILTWLVCDQMLLDGIWSTYNSMIGGEH